MVIKEITTKEELNSLGSALTIEGLAVDSILDFLNWIKVYTTFKNEVVYITKGITMNKCLNLTGTNQYPDDINIVSVKLEDMMNPLKLTLPRFEVGGRWMDDVIENNLRREREICSKSKKII